MVPILDGNSEIGVHVKNNRCYLICSNIFSAKRPIFLHLGAKFSELPSNIITILYVVMCQFCTFSASASRQQQYGAAGKTPNFNNFGL